MAITTATDLENHLIYSQNLKISVGADAVGGTSDDPDKEFVAINGVNTNLNHNRSRIDHGLTHSYAFASPDIEFSISIHATKDIWKELRARSTRNDQGALPIYKYKISATPIGETTAQTFTFEAYLYAMSFSRPPNQTGSVTTNFSLLVVGDSVEDVTFGT